MERLNDQDATRFQRVIAARVRQMWLRIAMAGLLAATLSVFIGLVSAALWTAAYVALQVVEDRWVRHLSPAAALRFGPLFLVVNSLAFGSISWLGAIAGGPFALGGAAFCLTGCILNAVVNAHGSRRAFWCSLGPYVVYVAGLPLIALQMGATLIQTVPLAVSVVMVPGLAFMTARALERALDSEERALGVAEERRREAETATEAKSRFVATVSHELRTPITAILAGSDALHRQLSGGQRDQAELIADAGGMMKGLLNDLLDMSKVEAGKLSLDATPVDLRRLVRQTHAFWYQQARQKGLRLRLEGARHIPETVVADPTRVRQILNNLLSNALKFTEAGSVTLAVEPGRAERSDCGLSFAVTDTGPGMTNGQLSGLFQPFNQGGDHIAGLHGGTGLGLAISRELAQLMGGDIQVASQIGVGSRFTFSAPFPVADPVVDTPPSEPPHTMALNVLVVDDHVINRRALTLILEAAAMRVSVAEDGPGALDRLRAEPFDLVLMDVNMPGMSGLEVVRRLRVSAGPNCAVPVFAVTGSIETSNVQACLEAGMTKVLAKPIEPGELLRAIATLEDGEPGLSEAA